MLSVNNPAFLSYKERGSHAAAFKSFHREAEVLSKNKQTNTQNQEKLPKLSIYCLTEQ